VNQAIEQQKLDISEWNRQLEPGEKSSSCHGRYGNGNYYRTAERLGLNSTGTGATGLDIGMGALNTLDDIAVGAAAVAGAAAAVAAIAVIVPVVAGGGMAISVTAVTGTITSESALAAITVRIAGAAAANEVVQRAANGL